MSSNTNFPSFVGHTDYIKHIGKQWVMQNPRSLSNWGLLTTTEGNKEVANESLKGISTKAKYLGTFENQSDEWHEQRGKGIGGSDVGVICGLSEWQSSYTLAAKRLGKIPTDRIPSEAMLWGTLLEDVILGQFEREHPELTIFKNVGTWAHPDYDWQQANPDAIFERADGSQGIIEIKTARYEDNWREGKDGEPNQIPPAYRAQVLWYLQTFGYKHAYVVVLFAGSKMKTFEVHYDEWEANANQIKAAKFWNDFLQRETLPPFSAPYTSTLETVRQMHPDITDNEVELGEVGLEYVAAQAKYNEADSELNLAKSKVLEVMGNAKRGLLEGSWMVTRQARNGGTPYLVNKR